MVADLVGRVGPLQRFVSALTPLEICSALRRREAARELSQHIAESAIDLLNQQMARYTVLDLSPEIVTGARGVIHRHRLRALDALQLASALSLASRASISLITFVAADASLLRAAAETGLKTLNPAEEEG